MLLGYARIRITGKLLAGPLIPSPSQVAAAGAGAQAVMPPITIKLKRVTPSGVPFSNRMGRLSSSEVAVVCLAFPANDALICAGHSGRWSWRPRGCGNCGRSAAPGGKQRAQRLWTAAAQQAAGLQRVCHEDLRFLLRSVDWCG